MFVPFEVAKNRYSICKDCDKFQSTIKICKECGCFMPAKITFAMSYCPLDKWSKSKTSNEIKDYKIDE